MTHFAFYKQASDVPRSLWNDMSPEMRLALLLYFWFVLEYLDFGPIAAD